MDTKQCKLVAAHKGQEVLPISTSEEERPLGELRLEEQIKHLTALVEYWRSYVFQQNKEEADNAAPKPEEFQVRPQLGE